MVFTDITAEHITWRWERVVDGGKAWQPTMIIEYRRQHPADDPTVVETSAVIRAPVERVFAAFATGEGLASWMVGQARVDLRPGGEVLTRYGKDGKLGDDQTIVHLIAVYDPNRLIVWKPVRAPATGAGPDPLAARPVLHASVQDPPPPR